MNNANLPHTLHHLTKKLARVDLIALRLSIIFIFTLFGTYKWFTFEANALNHLLPATWLGVLYPYLGVQDLRGGKSHVAALGCRVCPPCSRSRDASIVSLSRISCWLISG
ncbi:DUF417 family protein [Klebsiella aerogenes]